MEKSTSFPTVMKSAAVIALVLTVAFSLLCRLFPTGWILSAAISAGTTCYHFAMRLLVGAIIPHWVKNPMKYRWFQQKPFETKLYAALKVKGWKAHMPTYNPASFSLRENSLEQIIDNCCVSEAVHETIILLSFLPLLFTLLWGAFPVFLITSLLAAAFDSCFVIMQRYNRPRLVQTLSKKEAKARE